MILRVLHPRREILLFDIAWRWRETYPKRVRRWDMIAGFPRWLEAMQGRVSVGVFAPCLVALVSLEPGDEGIYEVHVDCERRVDHEVLLAALLSIRRTVFEQWGAQEVFAGVISRNYGIITIARQCGFTPDGISEQAGKLKFIRLRMTKGEYVIDQNKHQYLQHAEPVPTPARSLQPGY